MIKYTKGEWKESQSLTGERLIYAENGDYEIICSNIRHWNKDIIMAAPDMYEALKLYQSHQQGTSGHYCWQCAEAINKAIAKAEAK